LTGARPERALRALIDQLRPVVACVTAQPLLALRDRRAATTGQIVFSPESPRLRATHRQHTLLFSARLDYAIGSDDDSPRRFDVRTVSYTYRVLDREDNEIVAYHWHPDGVSSVRHPHLHLSNQIRPIDLGRNQTPLPLADYHLATGVVPLAHLVRMLIEEFGVEPLRDDWDEVLPRS
jgi:hypothetical protein